MLDDPDIDAVVIGTWPYLHCPITLAALGAGKHVLTEARMSLDAREAHEMLAAARRHPQLVTQIVPSPLGLKGHQVMTELVGGGFLGQLREVRVGALSSWLADAAAPLSWRQDEALSGVNMLALGIVHETLLRWVPPPIRVLAQAHAFVPSRIDPASGARRPVGTPDSVQAVAVLEGGARAVYQLSGVIRFGEETAVTLHGSDGVLHYDLSADRIFGTSRSRGGAPGPLRDLPEIPVPPERALAWRVEAEFIEAIREGKPVRFTDFATGVSYMEFTEAVARSARLGVAVELPLDLDVE
jgi:predicted dehydrogenase